MVTTRDVFLKSVASRIELLKSWLERGTCMSLAWLRSAPFKSGLKKFVWLRLAWLRSARLRLVLLR